MRAPLLVLRDGHTLDEELPQVRLDRVVVDAPQHLPHEALHQLHPPDVAPFPPELVGRRLARPPARHRFVAAPAGALESQQLVERARAQQRDVACRALCRDEDRDQSGGNGNEFVNFTAGPQAGREGSAEFPPCARTRTLAKSRATSDQRWPGPYWPRSKLRRAMSSSGNAPTAYAILRLSMTSPVVCRMKKP